MDGEKWKERNRIFFLMQINLLHFYNMTIIIITMQKKKIKKILFSLRQKISTLFQFNSINASVFVVLPFFTFKLKIILCKVIVKSLLSDDEKPY